MSIILVPTKDDIGYDFDETKPQGRRFHTVSCQK